MIFPNYRQQLILGSVLIFLLVLTRGHHFASINQLPAASWAVFFLAGVYLRPLWVLPTLLLTAFGLDLIAVTWGGVSNFCVSPAYPFLLPAYGSLWLGGRWLRRHITLQWSGLLPLIAAVVGSAFVCDLFSSGGFYFFSGRFEQTTLIEFGSRVVTYFPPYLASMAFYIAVAAVLHVVVHRIQHAQHSGGQTSNP